jgi:parallel beta-helix repeat protein
MGRFRVREGKKIRIAACMAISAILGYMLLFLLIVPRSALADQIAHDPIFIAGDNSFTQANGVNGGGTGTIVDPYVIENWILDAVNANGICIENTTAYFVIRNCLVKNTGTTIPGSGYTAIYLENCINGVIANNSCTNSAYGINLHYSSEDNLIGNTCDKNGWGISLDSSSNNNLTGNTCTNSGYETYSWGYPWLYYSEPGIRLISSSNNELSNNNCSNNSDGISLDSSSNYCNLTGNNCSNNKSNGISLSSYNNDLVNNTCSNNSSDGIYLTSSLNNNLSGNICSNNSTGIYLTSSSNINISNNTCLGNSSCGIYLESSSLNNDLTGNTCSNNSSGIYLTSSSNNNIISNNTCSSNSSGQGLYAKASSGCTISNNTFFNNRYGAYLTSSSNCKIFNNYLRSNTENNAYDDGSNSWDNGSIGNYWSDWQPPSYPENDNSGIISVPRAIAGGLEYDYYPLVLAGFSISVSQTSGWVAQGGVKTVIVSLTPHGDFDSTVSLSASGLPPDATAAFEPPSGTPSFTSTLTISIPLTTPTGTYTVNIMGAGGGDNHLTTYSLNVLTPSATPDFAISVNQTSGSMNRGESITTTVSLVSNNGFDSMVSLSASGLPPDATAAFEPISRTPNFTSTLTISTTSTTPVGTYPITVTGTGGGTIHEATYTLTVTTPDFTVSVSPTSGSKNRGESITTTVSLVPINGFDSTVSLSASGQPSEAVATFEPPSGMPGFTSTLTISTTSTTLTGTYSVSVTGTSGGITHEATYTLTVTTPDFTVSVSPKSGSKNRGESITAAVTVVPINGFDSPVSLSASGLPSGATPAFEPSNGTPSFTSTLIISTRSTTPTGTYTVTITGTGGGETHACTYSITVSRPFDVLLLLKLGVYATLVLVVVVIATLSLIKINRRRKLKPEISIKKLKNVVWSHKKGDLIWRIPNEGIPRIKGIKNFTVRGKFERAVIYKDGNPRVLNAGKYSTKDIDEIIYIDTSPQKNLKFVVPVDRGLMSSDKHKFGLNGRIELRIKESESDVDRFMNEVVGGKKSFKCGDLIGWLQEGPLPAVLRDIAKKATYAEFWRQEREEIIRAIRAKLGNKLAGNGLELMSIDIFEGSSKKA